MREIETALKALRDARAEQVKTMNLFNIRCEQFVKDCQEYMKITSEGLLRFGDTQQGVFIESSGKVTWRGNVTVTILENYEKCLLDQIRKTTEAINIMNKRY